MGKATAIDLGGSRIKTITVQDGKHGLAVTAFASAPAAEGPAAIAATGISLKDSVAGLAGKDMTLRFTQVPPSPDWQLQNLMELEIQDMASQSGGELSADYNLLPIEDEEGGMETILLAFARNEALEKASSAIEVAGGSVAGHVPNCVALYNAFLRCGPVEEDSVVCLVNIGRDTTDIAIARGVDLLFVRNLSSGGKVFDDAIESAFNVKPAKAEMLKKELLDLDPFSRGQYASGQAEKVTMAAGGAGNMMVSAIQSSLAFCRSQTKQADLQLDKVLICGGTARTRGIKGMLREALRVPVELFDPFESVDLSELDPESANDLDGARYEAVIALGLAATKLDDSLYQLEILPEAVKKRRIFMQQTIWNIAAGVVAAAIVVALFLHEKDRTAQAEVAKRQLKVLKTRFDNTHRDAEREIEKNAQSRALADYLASRAMPLHGTLLALRAFEEAPRALWLNQVEVLKDSRVKLKGSAKDVRGGDIGAVYRSFLTQFKASEHDGIKPALEPKADAQANFEWTIDFRPAAPAAAESEER